MKENEGYTLKECVLRLCLLEENCKGGTEECEDHLCCSTTKYHVWKGAYVAMLERRSISREENKREEKNTKTRRDRYRGRVERRGEWGGEEDRSRWAVPSPYHDTTPPCYGQVYSTGARQDSL